MEVIAVAVRLEHPSVQGDLGCDPQLDLRVVGLDQHSPPPPAAKQAR